MKLAFLGTPEVAADTLRALVDDGHEVSMVVTRADRRRGRGGTLTPSPVKSVALELGLPVSSRVDDVLDAGVDLGVVVAFGRLIKPHVLARVPMVNVHYSLLPRWRGAAPVERAILTGDGVTGVSLMALDEGLDTGPLYETAATEIGPEETADELRARLSALGIDLLLRHLRAGLPEPKPQQGETTYAEKLDPSIHQIEWSRPAEELARLVRLGQAWTTFRGKRLKVLRARAMATDSGAADGPEPGHINPDTLRVTTGAGTLELLELQPEGRARQAAAAWRNGARLLPEEILGDR